MRHNSLIRNGRRLLMVLAGALVASSASAAPCPTQPATLVALGGQLSICSNETVATVQLEKDGVVQPPITLALTPGVVTPLPPQTACALTSLRARVTNAAGSSPWGAVAPTTFQPCFAPALLP